VDRAALDVALALGISHGGWCPAGRAAEDGPVPERYRLSETPSADPAQRTAWNVRDSDATLVLSGPGASGGTARTLEAAREYDRPLLVVPPDVAHVRDARAWLREIAPEVLNVAGPRESEAPGIHGRSVAFLEALLS
jgi:hypothetical protein